jgi:hypothetical protein
VCIANPGLLLNIVFIILRITTMSKILPFFIHKRHYIFMLTLLAMSACSSVPKPVAQLASAETAIAGAEKIEAPKYATVELDRAQNKLVRAKEEMKKGNNNEARRLAEQALAEAEYASAKTVATRVNASTQQMEDSVRILKNQINQ